MRLLFRALFKEFALCILSLWVYRRVCAPGCSFVRCCARWRVTGGCGGRGRAGLCLGASLGEAGALSILLPHAQGVSGAATAGMMLIVGALPAVGAGLRALRCCLAKAGGDGRALLWLCAPSAAPVPGWGHRHQNSSCRKAGGSRASPGLQSEPAQGEILEPNLSKACSGLGHCWDLQCVHLEPLQPVQSLEQAWEHSLRWEQPGLSCCCPGIYFCVCSAFSCSSS